MGLFKKKPDPISERARELNSKIAALEAEIKRLASKPPERELPVKPLAPSLPTPLSAPELKPPTPAELHPKSAASVSESKPAPPHPRLRSTALPHGPTITNVPANTQPAEPIFEEVDERRLQREPEEKKVKVPDKINELGMRKNGLLALYQRIRSQFRGPATTNPKLVNYLAAGSIQGLRPLRYEKRIARNRFIILAVVLILLLWGIITILVKR